jgi:hypothetical protein
MDNIPIKLIDDNPFRHRDLNPIDPAQVAKLKDSIDKDGFWASVVARERGGRYQLAYGHTRIAAARDLKLATVPIDVRELSDLQMARMLANENGIQRDAGIAPCVDAVAGISEVLAYALMVSENETTFSRNCEKVPVDYGSARGRLIAGSGIGEPCISAVTDSYNSHQVREALSILKDSGRMAEIVSAAKAKADAEVQARAEAARAELEAAAEREAAAKDKPAKQVAKVATKKAAAAVKQQAKVVAGNTKAVASIARKKPRIFDDRCVHLFRLEAHAEAFRKFVIGETVRSYLPVKKQYDFARHVMQHLTSLHHLKEITADLIRSTCWERMESTLGIPKAKLRNAPDRPTLDSIREGLNRIRRGRGDFIHGMGLVLDALNDGEALDSRQAEHLDAMLSDIDVCIRQLADRRKPKLRLVEGRKE